MKKEMKNVLKVVLVVMVFILGLTLWANAQDNGIFIRFQLDESNNIGLLFEADGLDVGDTLSYAVEGQEKDFIVVTEEGFYDGGYFYSLSKTAAKEISTKGITNLYRNEWDVHLTEEMTRSLAEGFTAFAKRYNYTL